MGPFVGSTLLALTSIVKSCVRTKLIYLDLCQFSVISNGYLVWSGCIGDIVTNNSSSCAYNIDLCKLNHSLLRLS